uniref:Uncharacterized protein n=1 Tax=Hippocampus comes TaxID=109280 RepID=A0A3Q2YKB6_HIPCM
MHQAQIERLEAQVISHRLAWDFFLSLKSPALPSPSCGSCTPRRDLALSQKECEQLTGHLRRSEKEAAALRADAAPRVAASCLKCAQEAAFSAGAPATAHGQFVDRLAKWPKMFISMKIAGMGKAGTQPETCTQGPAELNPTFLSYLFWSTELQINKNKAGTPFTRGHARCVCAAARARLFSACLSAGQEVEKLSSELVGCRQRLEAVQRDGGQWRAEALSLAEQLASAQRQLHLTRCAFASTLASLSWACLFVCAAVGELDGLLSSQDSLIKKLTEECRTLGATLEELTGNKRREVERLTAANRHLRGALNKTTARCSDMEKQCVQHGRVHRSMKNRLQQLDRHCQSSARQVCELLAKHNHVTMQGGDFGVFHFFSLSKM